ncbi:hypothetical protein CHUAL_007638 [Chamberlinius hualienensis]
MTVSNYMILASNAEDLNVLATCPCSDQSWCNAIQTGPRKEVFIFTLTPDNTTWLKFDWNKVTTIVNVGFYSPDLMCYAHSKGVRVVNLSSLPASQLLNETRRAEWIQEQVQDAQTKFLDGLNIDMEDPIENGSPEVAALTQLSGDTRVAFAEAIPGSQVTFDIAWSPAGIDGRFYDAIGLSEAVDFLFVMSYDEQSQIYDSECTARANSPIPMTTSGIQQYLSLGISPDKLVLGVPWYGYKYECIQITSNNTCYIEIVPFRGVNCSDAAGSQHPYVNILASYLNISTTGRIWDETSQSPYFNFIDTSTGATNQVWYDDPESLSVKYQYAIDNDLRGVGMWTSDFLDYSDSATGVKQRSEMWGALPQY